jgi:hypothetical protein
LLSWVAIQRSRYNEEEIPVSIYDYEGNYSGDDLLIPRRTYNISESRATPKASDVIDIVSGSSLTLDPAITKVTNIYRGGSVGELIINSIFQNWAVDGSYFLPVDWTANFPNLIERYTDAFQGDYSAQINKSGAFPLAYLQQSGKATLVADSQRYLIASVTAKWRPPLTLNPGAGNPTLSYWSLKVGSHYLNSDGSWTPGSEVKIQYRGGLLVQGGVRYSWTAHTIQTDPLDGVDGDLELRLYEGEDNENQEGILWDAISVKLVDPAETGDIITQVIDTSAYRLTPLNMGTFNFGDGPASDSDGAIKVGDDVTTGWILPGVVTGETIEKTVALMILRSLAQPTRIIRGEFLMDAVIVNAFIIFGRLYIINGGEYDIRWGRWSIELQEVIDINVNYRFESVEIEIKQIEEAANSIEYASDNQLVTVRAIKEYGRYLKKI